MKKCSLSLLSIVAGLGASVLTGIGSRSLAQTTGAINPTSDQAEQSAKDEPPPGGCMPIGVTASGEIVFPFLCKGFIEHHKAASQKPAAEEASQKPAADEAERAAEGKPKSAQQQPESAARESATKEPESVTPPTTKPAAATTEPAAPQKATTEPAPPQPQKEEPKRPREGRAGPSGCTHFHSYEPSSGTYTDYSGRRRACRS